MKSLSEMSRATDKVDVLYFEGAACMGYCSHAVKRYVRIIVNLLLNGLWINQKCCPGKIRSQSVFGPIWHHHTEATADEKLISSYLPFRTENRSRAENVKICMNDSQATHLIFQSLSASVPSQQCPLYPVTKRTGSRLFCVINGKYKRFHLKTNGLHPTYDIIRTLFLHSTI